MDDVISRQAALNIRFSDAINEDGVLYVPLRDFTDGLKALSPARPDLDEWCTDCSEYDQERHCCPRWNRVIRQTLKDVHPKLHYCRECKWSKCHINVDKYGKSETYWRCINWDGETDEEGYCHEWKRKTDG